MTLRRSGLTATCETDVPSFRGGPTGWPVATSQICAWAQIAVIASRSARLNVHLGSGLNETAADGKIPDLSCSFAAGRSHQTTIRTELRVSNRRKTRLEGGKRLARAQVVHLGRAIDAHSDNPATIRTE